jgi:hypothetical protein
MGAEARIQMSRRCRGEGTQVVMHKKILSGTGTVPIPDQAEIRIGALQSIIRQSGVVRSEFGEWVWNYSFD